MTRLDWQVGTALLLLSLVALALRNLGRALARGIAPIATGEHP